MLPQIRGNLRSVLRLAFDKIVVVVIISLILLVESHKLGVGAVAREPVLGLLVEAPHIVELVAEVPEAPLIERFGQRVLKDKRAVAVVDELYEAALEHLAPHHVVGYQGNLVSGQLPHSLCRECAAHKVESPLCELAQELLVVERGEPVAFLPVKLYPLCHAMQYIDVQAA